MRKYRPYIIFLTFIIVGLTVFSIISAGYYPILSVNGHLVSARTFWKSYQAGSIYYQNIIEISGPNIPENEVLSQFDLKRSVLTQLIENVLIEEGAKSELGDDLNYLVKNKISKLNQDKKTNEATQILYGLGFADFEKIVLVPLARQEILTGRLFLEGQDLEDWLEKAKKSSQVKIFSGEFLWNGSEVQARSDN